MKKGGHLKTGLFTLEENPIVEESLLRQLRLQRGGCHLHRFPDGETLIQVAATEGMEEAIVLCSLKRPNEKIVNLILLSETLRDAGIKKIGLVAPYLAYMRQDTSFHQGEGISAKYIATLLSTYFDWLLTVDPHLHRIHALKDVYKIPVRSVSAMPAVVAWIQKHIPAPLLIGPDSESEQWIQKVAEMLAVPYAALKKQRFGDSTVAISVPDLGNFTYQHIVILDDIISSAGTMLALIEKLKPYKKPISCIAVHGIFANAAFERLQQAGVTVITVNTILHPTNQIDISPGIIAELQSWNP